MPTLSTSRRESLNLRGVPWTTMSFGDVQMEPGKPRCPLNAGVAPCERMKRSAAWSSSSVVTPGRTLPASRSMVRTRMSPAGAMLSISAGVFLMIMGSEPFFEPERREGGPDVVVDLGRAARAVEAPEQALLLVVVDQRLGLLMVGREALLHHLGLVVLAQLERAAAEVAHPLGLRRVERHVLDVAVRALAAAGQPLHHDVVR